MKRAWWALAALVCLPAGSAWAAPFEPVSDAEVLETLPLHASDPKVRRLQVLRALVAQRPDNLPAAVELARRYVELGRVTGDPRYAGYAQAALAPWWRSPDPPRDVLILRATLLQRMHLFDDALVDLQRALERNPRDAQARLTRATVLQVRGDFEAARQDCAALRGVAPDLIATACAANVDAVTGRLRAAYQTLSAATASQPVADAGIRVWLLTGLAEMANRAGLFADADLHFQAALRADPSDQYLLAAYADYLLESQRPGEAAALLKDYIQADGLLLRHALALDRQRSPDAPARIAELRARFDASRMRGDRIHLREEARFTLHLAHDPAHALRLAQENWKVQKEPADVRVLFEAASAAGDSATVQEMMRWIEQTHLEDAYLQRFTVRHPSG